MNGRGTIWVGVALVLGLIVEPALAVVPGTNGRIAFTSARNGTFLPHIFTASASGQGIVQLTGGKKVQYLPAWSPDHTKIAYQNQRAGSPPIPGGGRIFVMNANGSGKHLVVEGGESPAWSPDGTKLLFVYPEIDNYEVAYANSSNGGGMTMVTNSGEDEEEPDWSPDGTKIAFARQDFGGGRHIYTIDLNGTNLTPLTSGTDIWDNSPKWSPDGTKIAFKRDLNIWVMDADGTNPVNLTSSLTKVGGSAPSWSPDGTSILFTRFRKKSYSIFKMAADGTGVVRLVSRDRASADQPDWGTG